MSGSPQAFSIRRPNQYLVDVQKWGFHDARLQERVHMDSQEIAQWTKAIPKEEKVS